MDNRTLQTISTGPSSTCFDALKEFNSLHEKTKDFKGMDSKTKEMLWDAIFSRMKLSLGDKDPEIIPECLNSLRILSRDKATLEKVMTEDRITTLLSLSGLCVQQGSDETPTKSVEGLKVIFNMVFQSPTLQVMFISDGILSHLINRIQDFTKSATLRNGTQISYPQEFQYFACRILFLITALCQDIAPAKVRNAFNGLFILASYLESIMANMDNTSLPITSATEQNETFSDNVAADIICEVLKVLYNLVADLNPKNKRNESFESEIDGEDLEQLMRITRITRMLLLRSTSSSSTPNYLTEGAFIQVDVKRQDIRRHSIDLLAAVPGSCFAEFVPPLPTGEPPPTPYIFEYYDMAAVEGTLQYLSEKLDDVKKGVLSPDFIAPPLLALHNMGISNRAIRKYLKRRILPPLKRMDVVNLPEEGETIRNKLVALLTSPITHITDLVANLLFVLCKEKVGKLVKYTGYGNAAGLLANRGLMLGGQPPPGKYSDSESADDGSDTEEYREVEHLINHVEGRIQLDRPDPMEGMTDEQKEYEAIKLINAIDKMDRCSSGGIRPCRIGPDGRPEPIEHVLQLQEALENPMKGLRRDDTDSDSD